MACHSAMLVAARAGEANERDANKRAAKAATICKRRNAGITMALPVSRGKRRLYLLKARPLRFQPGMSTARAAQSFRGAGRDGLPSTICQIALNLFFPP